METNWFLRIIRDAIGFGIMAKLKYLLPHQH